MPANTLKAQDQHKVRLQQQLPQLEALSRLSKMPEWVMYLKPHLNQALSNKWLDPSLDEDDTTFRRKYSHAHARMEAFKELITMVDSSDQRIEEINRQLEVATKEYAI